MEKFKNISRLIQSFREDVFHLTQEKFANKLGITRSTISSVEIGRVKPSLSFILTLSIALDYSPSIILSGRRKLAVGVRQIFSLEESKKLAESIINFLPTRIKVSRDYLKLSQQELAEKTGIGQSKISDIERGISVPSCEQFIAIANGLDLRPGWLLAYKLENFKERHPKSLSKDHPLRELVTNQLINNSITIGFEHFSKENANLSNDFIDMVNYLQDIYETGDIDLIGWAKIQFSNAFPDYKDLKRKGF